MKIEYHNLYTHFILITQNRIPFIPEKNRDRIEKYISALLITTAQGCIVSTQILSISTFLFPGLQDYLEEVLATKVADSSSKFVNDNKLTHGQFKWQESASAFSVSKSEVDKVCKYILNQPEHHRKVSFAEEYNEFIKYYQKTLKWEIS